MFADFMHSVLCIILIPLLFLIAAFTCKLYVLISFLRQHRKKISQYKSTLTLISIVLVSLLYQDLSLIVGIIHYVPAPRFTTAFYLNFFLSPHITSGFIIAFAAYCLISIIAFLRALSLKH